MKNLTFFTLTAFIGCFAFIMTGCSKGNTGPAGPAGPDSVTYTNWAPLAMSYQGSDSLGDPVYAQAITAKSITSDILNKGVILTYLQQIYTNPADTAIVNASIALTEFFYVGEIDLYSFGTDFTGTNYRYVIIPGTVVTTKFSGYSKEQLKTINYQNLTKVLNAPATSQPSTAQPLTGH